jgi:hypothetical protein
MVSQTDHIYIALESRGQQPQRSRHGCCCVCHILCSNMTFGKIINGLVTLESGGQQPQRSRQCCCCVCHITCSKHNIRHI